MSAFFTVLRAALVVIYFIGGNAAAHEGHDHGAQSTAPVAAAIPRTEARSGPFELVAMLQKGELVVYLDRWETNAPITDAQIDIETPEGPKTAEAKPDGSYRLPATWAKGSSVDLIITVTLGDSVEVIAGAITVASAMSSREVVEPIGLLSGIPDLRGQGSLALAAVSFAAGLFVMGFLRRKRVLALALIAPTLLVPDVSRAHEGENHDEPTTASVGVGDISQRLPDGTLFVPKPVQRILAIRTAVTAVSSHTRTIELPGRIMPDPNANGFVQASVSGRLSPPQGGFPRLGTVVKAGDTLAFVTPPFQAIDVSDMLQKAGEIDQQMTIVQQRVLRYEPLLKNGSVPRATYDEAMTELKGLRERRAALDRTRAEPERLVTPVSGVIASVNAVSGQIAETNAVVFQIIDPEKLWVEALTFAVLPNAERATARTGEGHSLPLSFQGAGLTDRSQAIPVHFAIEGDTKRLRVGQLVTVLAATGEMTKGVALPRTATLRNSNGQTIVYEHSGAERFVSRIVRVEPLDADRVLILDGVTAGARIVVQGAELLNQVR